MTKLKNAHIIGFNTDKILDAEDKLMDYMVHHFWPDKLDDIIYNGKTSDIPEEIADLYCDWMFWDEKIERKRYFNYGKRVVVSYPFLTAKESIQSACKGRLCIIFKNTKI